MIKIQKLLEKMNMSRKEGPVCFQCETWVLFTGLSVESFITQETRLYLVLPAGLSDGEVS